MSLSTLRPASGRTPGGRPDATSSANDLDPIRNVGIIAHIDAGKTTVTERILYLTGRIHRMGEVHDGEATMDYLPEERERGITITSAATNCQWKRYALNLIDTPGHVDFTAEVERSLRVLDGVVGVFCGVAGVEAQSETVWRQATRYGVPRIAFINKLDRVGADFDQAVQSIRTRLGACPVPIQLPHVRDGQILGLVDLVEMVYLRLEDREDEVVTVREPIPSELADAAQAEHTAVVEAAADFSDSLMARYLEGESVAPEEIRRALREGTLSGALVPLLGGAALRNRGIEQLLDAIGDYLPSPANKPIVEGRRPGDASHLVHIEARRESPLCALAFKTISDRNGDLTFLRIYAGVLRRGEQVWNSRLGRTERVGRLFKMHADAREAIEEAAVGEIVACVGMKETVTGDTLCDPDHPLVLERMAFPEPVVSMSIAPASRNDRDKLSESLARLTKEDPTFRYYTDEETSEMIICGMGELHLEIIQSRLTREFGLQVKVGQPEVAYKQALVRGVEVVSRHIKQTGGHGQYAVIHVRVGPGDGTADFQFEESVVGGRVPREYFRPVEEGLRGVLAEGGTMRYPFVNVRAELFDGSYHEVDSSELAFELAARQAALAAIEKAGTILMEPLVSFEVQVPDEFLGDVLADLNSRRAQVSSMELEHGVRVLRGKVPLAETFRYATQIRSLTQGRGNYSLEPCEYAPVPKALAEEIYKERRERLAARR